MIEDPYRKRFDWLAARKQLPSGGDSPANLLGHDDHGWYCQPAGEIIKRYFPTPELAVDAAIAAAAVVTLKFNCFGQVGTREYPSLEEAVIDAWYDIDHNNARPLEIRRSGRILWAESKDNSFHTLERCAADNGFSIPHN